MMEHLIAQGSSYAPRIDHLVDLIAIITGVWLLIAYVVFFGFIFKYSRKKQPKSHYVTGETHEDGKWVHRAHYSVILCDIVVLYFAATAWHHVKQEMPTPDKTIRIVGEQWAWKFTDPGKDNQLDTADDITVVDELHVQVNTTYQFKLEAKDVVHSFSVPVFRLKQDAIPGRVITGWFKPTLVGEFDIQCTQMCGIGHGAMGAKIIVETPEQHAAWVQENTKAVASVPSTLGRDLASNSHKSLANKK